MIVLTKTITSEAKMSPNFKWTITLSDKKYQELCSEFGTFSVDWYFTETEAIKYYDGKEWHYESNWR